MRIRVPKTIWRLGVLSLVLAASLTAPRPAASCVDNPQCAHDCDITCSQVCGFGACGSYTMDQCRQDCYRQCAGC